MQKLVKIFMFLIGAALVGFFIWLGVKLGAWIQTGL